MIKLKFIFQSLGPSHAIVLCDQLYFTGADSDLKLYITVRLRNSRQIVTIIPVYRDEFPGLAADSRILIR